MPRRLQIAGAPVIIRGTLAILLQSIAGPRSDDEEASLAQSFARKIPSSFAFVIAVGSKVVLNTDNLHRMAGSWPADEQLRDAPRKRVGGTYEH